MMKRILFIVMLGMFALNASSQDTLQIITPSDIFIDSLGVGSFDVDSYTNVLNEEGDSISAPYFKMVGFEQGIPDANKLGKHKKIFSFDDESNFFWHGYHDTLVVEPIYQFAKINNKTYHYDSTISVWIENIKD